jgi:hypothetical protein
MKNGQIPITSQHMCYDFKGGDVRELGKIDGMSQWKAWKKEGPPARDQFLYNIDDSYNNSAVRIGPWKVIQGMWKSTNVFDATNHFFIYVV